MRSDNEVSADVRRLLENSIGSVGSDTRWDTTRLLDQYHGRKYGTEVEGRSQIVTRAVLETIEWAMPSMMKVFGASERVVMFTPNGDEDVEQAEFETDYVNHIFLKDSDGWAVLADWIRSALLERNAYVKVHWDKQRRTRITTYERLTAMQLQAVLEGDRARFPTGYRFQAAEVLEQTSEPAVDPLTGQPLIDPMTGEPVEVYTVRVREVATRGFARAEYVPREEIRISKDASTLSLDHVTMTAHVRNMHKSDVLELMMGWGWDYEEAREVVDSLPSDRTTDLASNTVQYARQNERSTQRTEYQAPDDASKMIQIDECYVRLDVDEDGISELRRVILAGDKVLVNEEVESQPLVALCPIPQPATHIGLGLGDLVEDIQLIQTHLWRSILDNLALTNNPKKEVTWDDMSFPDDLLTDEVGQVYRVDKPGTVNMLTVPFSAKESVPIVDLLDQMKEARTGISRHTMGLDADTLATSTVGAFSMGLEQANQRLEMIARTFAETGITELFVKLRELVVRYQDVPRMVRLSGKFVEVDPRDWSERYDCTAQVGLGTGRTAQTLGHLQAIAAKQEEHLQAGSPLTDDGKLYNTYEHIMNAAGFKDVSRAWNEPGSEEYNARVDERNKASTAQQEAQAEQMRGLLQVEMAKIDGRMQEALLKAEAEMVKQRGDFQEFLEENRRKWAELELKYTVDVPGEGIEGPVIGGNGGMQ